MKDKWSRRDLKNTCPGEVYVYTWNTGRCNDITALSPTTGNHCNTATHYITLLLSAVVFPQRNLQWIEMSVNKEQVGVRNGAGSILLKDAWQDYVVDAGFQTHILLSGGETLRLLGVPASVTTQLHPSSKRLWEVPQLLLPCWQNMNNLLTSR